MTNLDTMYYGEQFNTITHLDGAGLAIHRQCKGMRPMPQSRQCLLLKLQNPKSWRACTQPLRWRAVCFVPCLPARRGAKARPSKAFA